MNPLQKKSDGIRIGTASGPIRLSPRHQNPEETPSPAENEYDGYQEGEESAEKLYEIGSREKEKVWKEAAIIHEPFLRDTRPLRRFWKKREQGARRERPLGDGKRETSSRHSWGVRGAYAGGGAVVLLFILLSTVFARLTVTVKPRVEEAAIMRIGILFDTSVSKVLLEQKVIPAEILHFSRAVSKDFSATGRAKVEERARGKAMIYNAFNSSPQQLVAGTRFVTDRDAIYRIQKPVTVPAAKIEQGKVAPQGIEVELVSDSAEESANLSGPVSLKLPGFKGTPRYAGFYATAEQGFGGAWRGDATVVTADDIKRAEEEVSKAAFGEVEGEMTRKIPAGLSVLKELREIEIVKITAPKAGSRAEAPVTVSAEAKGTALAFREQDVIGLLASFALAENKNHEFVPGSARLSYGVRSINFEKGKAEATVGGDLRTKAKIPEQELAILIAGKKEGSVAEIFKKRPELESFALSFFPPWRSTVPADPDKIRFRVENP